jgi:circadian clock protein KaiC
MKEVTMAGTLFDRPLFVRRNGYFQELASLEDVFDLLDDWPEEERGDAYEVLLKACRFAAQGIFPLSAVRENIRRFLIKHRALANIEEVPLILKQTHDRNVGS